MAELVKVWDPEGGMHEVLQANATDLCQHKGWTRSGPSESVAKAPAKEEAPKVEAAPVAEEAPVEVETEEPSSAEEEEPKKKRGRPSKD